MTLGSAREAVLGERDPREGEGFYPGELTEIGGLTADEKRVLAAEILERVNAEGGPDYRQLLALEALGSPRAEPLLREAFAAAGRTIGDWKDFELAVALWRVAGDEEMLDYVLGALSAMFVTRRLAAARALAGAPCLKATQALERIAAQEGEPRLKKRAAQSLAICRNRLKERST